MAITAHYIFVDQIKTFYETNNSDCPETIICLHAEGRETRQFHGLMEALSDHFRVIAFDMPAHGKTWPLQGNIPISSQEQYLDFIWKAVKALGAETPILLGCGLGANCSLALAQRHSAQLKGIVAISGASQTLANVSTQLLMHPQVSLPFVVQEYNKSITGYSADAEARELICWQAWCETAITFQADVEILASFDVRDRMPAIKCPALLIKGTDDWTIDDAAIQETLDGLAEAEKLQYVSLEGAGRYAMLEQPGKAAQVICNFWNTK